MSIYSNLPKGEREKVGAKLAELQTRTGKNWTYAIHYRPEPNATTPLLEVTVDGTRIGPLYLPQGHSSPGEVLCRAFERCLVTANRI